MGNQINENAGPSMTTWTPLADGGVQNMYSTGYMSRVFSTFFATQAQNRLLMSGDPRRFEGDVLLNPAGIEDPRQPLMSYSRNQPFIVEAEMNRKRRYDEYEKMDDYPEITAALDIYADDCTQKDTRNKLWVVDSDSIDAIEEVEDLFKKVKLDHYYWDIFRNSCKFGDAFVEVVANALDMTAGIQKIKILNPYFILRLEDKFGRLQTFLQEIPEKNSSPGYMYQGKSQYIELDRNQIVHFRLHTSDPKYYPYGKSILAGAIRVYRSLKLMEDAMLVYRLSRAPERRIFYVDVGNLPSSKAEHFLETMKTRFKKEKFHNQNKVDGRYNPLAVDEDFFVPVRGNQGTKIDTLPGAQNLGEVDDVKYFRDKLLATLKIPKDYIVEFDKSPERKANLSQLDVKFARVIKRVQESVAVGFTEIAKKHLSMLGYPQTIINDVKIRLPDPSDVFITRKLQIDETKARVVQAVVGTGLFPQDYIYKEFYDMTDTEIEMVKKDLQAEQEQSNQEELAQTQAETDIQTNANMQQQAQQAELQQQQAPQGKNEELETLKNRYLMEEGPNSPKYKAISRILRNKTK